MHNKALHRTANAAGELGRSVIGDEDVKIIVLNIVWLVGLLPAPVFLLIAGCRLWRSSPRWIPRLLVVVAVLIPLVALLPMALSHLCRVESVGKISLPLALLEWCASLGIAIVVFVLASQRKRMTEQ
jgi:hypothetical protein